MAAVGRLILVSPAMIVIAALIKLDSLGPVLYISKRMGRRGHFLLLEVPNHDCER